MKYFFLKFELEQGVPIRKKNKKEKILFRTRSDSVISASKVKRFFIESWLRTFKCKFHQRETGIIGSKFHVKFYLCQWVQPYRVNVFYLFCQV